MGSTPYRTWARPLTGHGSEVRPGGNRGAVPPVLRLHNRPGNVNDGRASLTFLRELFQQVQTLRFELFNRAGLLLQPNGRTILRLADNPIVKKSRK